MPKGLQLAPEGKHRRAASGPPRGERRHIGRFIGWLYMAGSALGALSLLLPNPSPNREALLAIVVSAFLVGAPLWLFHTRVPLWASHVVTALGAVMISLAVYVSGDSDSVYALMFVWVVLLAAYFFPTRHMWAHLVWLLAGYGLALAMLDHARQDFSPVTRWILTMIALGVSGVLTSRLVAKRRETERVNRELAAIIDSSQDAIMSVDLDGTITSWNDGAEAIYGYTAADAIGRTSSMLAPPDRPEEVSTIIDRVRSGHPVEHYETVRKRADGQLIDVSLAVSPICDDDGVVTGASAVARDITARRRLENDRQQLLAQIRALARTDALTGLANRRAWDAELDRELARAERRDSETVVALLDLDRFKRFNDEHGHLAGDDLLKQAAESWRSTVRSSDFMARYGGEEFAVLLSECSLEEALETIERLRQSVPMEQTCSVGVATWDGQESATMLTSRADAALYEAKRGGRDRVHVAASEAEPRAVAG